MSRLRRCPSGSAVSLALASAGCFSPTGSAPATTTDASSTQDPGTQTSAVDPTTTTASTTEAPSTSTGSSSAGSTTTIDATTQPDTPVCGNGRLEDGEACDDGEANADAAPCRSDCTLATCGDAVRCATCRPLEECDDGNLSAGDGCSDTCRIEGRLIFLTPSTWTGDVSVAQADQTCKELGAAYFRPGRDFIAWLSTSSDAIVDRIGDSQLPYRLPGGEQVASGTASLLSAALDRPIDQDATGVTVTVDAACQPESLVWTGTDADGTTSELTCGDWTLQRGTGGAGVVGQTGPEWSAFCTPDCSESLRLYCIQTAF